MTSLSDFSAAAIDGTDTDLAQYDGKVVLVAGGAGAVGHAAIQLARWAGATVISTISGPEKARLAVAAGAHHVINYRDGTPAAEIRAIAPDGVDVIAEVAQWGDRYGWGQSAGVTLQIGPGNVG